jgi:hypothetical protein
VLSCLMRARLFGIMLCYQRSIYQHTLRCKCIEYARLIV